MNTPVVVAAGQFWRCRNGSEVFLDTDLALPYTVNGVREFWFGAAGVFLGTGGRCSWQLNGKYSPVSTNELDLVEQIG